MMTARMKELRPEVRRRNRILLLALVLIALAMAVTGVLYLREYGFPNEKSQSIYH
jgi:hypothetical protein